MRKRLFGLLSAGALIAGGSVLVAAAPASAGETSSVDVTIKKVVNGDDPGVAFPIVLSCTSEGPSAHAADINLGHDDTDTFTVNLEDGESQTVPVEFSFPVDTVTCDVTEDVSDADLPSGWECDPDPDISPSHFTVFDSEDNDNPDEVDVTVENDCTAPTTTTTTTSTTMAPKPPAPPAPAPTPVVAAARFTG